MYAPHDDFEYHYQSRIPLASSSTSFPTPPPRRRTSFSPPITQHSSTTVFIQDYPSPTHTSRLAPRPPPIPQPGSPRPISTSSSRRKPVPKFLPDPEPSTPFYHRSPAGSTAGDHLASPNLPRPGSDGRRSIGGFEALLARGINPLSPSLGAGAGVSPHVPGYTAVSPLPSPPAVEQVQQQQYHLDPDGGLVVWSPRIHLGLDPSALEACEQRLQHDLEPSAPRIGLGVVERDVGEQRLVLLQEEEQERTPRQPQRRAAFDDAPPAVVSIVSHSDAEPRTPPRARPAPGSAANTPSHETGSLRRFLTPKSARSRRSRMTSYDPQYPLSILDDEDEEGAEEYREKGPVLRRGSKRLSELQSAGEEEDDEEREGGDAAGTGGSSASSTGKKGRTRSVLSKTRRSRLAVKKERDKAPHSPPLPLSVGEKHAEDIEVVVHSSTASEGETDGWDGMQGDWERIRRETTCRPERMNWSMVDFEGWFPRLLHLLYPFAIFAHIPATLFLDYNHLYLLVQLARYPSLPSPLLRNIATRALVDVPDVQASTGFWVAVGIYAACTAAWFVHFLWVEIGRELVGKWGGGGNRTEIKKDLQGSYNLACIRSYSVFSFLWRVRLAPFQPNSPLALAVEGTTWTDGVKESFAWYRQNWPTVLLLVPRAGLSVAILLLYSTTAYSSSSATISRDSAYFDRDGTLSSFATGILFANAVWAAWRLVLLVGAWFFLWLVDRSSLFSLFRTERSVSTSSKLVLPPSPLPYQTGTGKSSSFSLDPASTRRPSTTFSTWRTRRQRRLRAAILACLGSTPLTAASATFSPFLRSPYMFGLSPSVSGGKFPNYARPVRPWDEDEKEPASSAVASAGDVCRRASAPAVQHSVFVEREEAGPMMTSPGRGGPSSWTRYILPQPNLHNSPLISFSPATPPQPQFEGPPAVLGASTSGVQHRRKDSTAAGEGAAGDVGESQLHRRVRSLPRNQDGGLVEQEHQAIIHFDAPAALPYFSSSSPVPPPHLTRPSSNILDVAAPEPSPTTVLHRSDTYRALTSPPSRPDLISRFSAFSSNAPSTAQPSPAATIDQRLLFQPTRSGMQSAAMSRQTTSSSFASPMPPHFLGASSASAFPAARAPPATSAAAYLPPDLDAQLAAGAAERERLSSRLLDEVQRLHEAEAALAREERRVAGLKRISEVASSAPRRSAEEEREAEGGERTSGSSSDDEGPFEYVSAAELTVEEASNPSPLPLKDNSPEVEEEADPRRFSETSAWSRPLSVGGLSESSTLRGAVRTPDATSSCFSHFAAAQEEGPTRGPAGLEPFRLSYGPDADGLSLSAYGSPEMARLASEDRARFDGPPPVEK
ncbi:hypothetical protein JCM8097_008864 [Rhodosporidiobolus ruineniae]